MSTLADRGIEARSLSRSSGVDIVRGEGLFDALKDVSVVIDCLNTTSISAKKALDFFVTTTTALLEAGSAAGIQHHVVASIVGIDRATSYGYYRAKLAQEELVRNSVVPHSIVRITQFHEFCAQFLRRTHVAGSSFVPHMPVQSVAARSAASALVDVAVGEPQHVEVAGPQRDDLFEQAQELVRARGDQRRVRVLKVTPGMTEMLAGAMLPTGEHRVVGPVFTEWLTFEDAQSLPL